MYQLDCTVCVRDLLKYKMLQVQINIFSPPVITKWEHLVFKVRLSVDMEMHSHSFFMSQQHSPGLFRIFFVTASAKVSAGAFTHIHKAYL